MLAPRSSRPTLTPDSRNARGPVPLRAIGVEATDDPSADAENVKAQLAAKQEKVAAAAEGTSLADTAKLLESLTKDPEAEAKKKAEEEAAAKAALEPEPEPEPELTYWEKVPPSPERPPVTVTFHIEMETNFGDHLCICGGHDLLGNWEPAKGIEMDWVEGIKWKVTVALPAHSLLQYKYVIRSGWADDGTCTWQGGPDGLVATGAAHSNQVIRDIWQHGD